MKEEGKPHNEESGLTLLEIVVSFIIAAFLGSMLVEYMGTSLTRSGESVVMVQDEFLLNGVMEKITADYESEYLKGDYDFDTFRNNIINGNNAASTPYYGDYTVQAAAYIVFTGGNEAPDTSSDNNILKVTIDSGNQALTTLFRK